MQNRYWKDLLSVWIIFKNISDPSNSATSYELTGLKYSSQLLIFQPVRGIVELDFQNKFVNDNLICFIQNQMLNECWICWGEST